MRVNRLASIGVAWLVVAACGDAGNSGDADGGGSVDGVEFRNLRVEELSAYRAVIRFETSIESTCEVQFGTESTLLDASATDPNMEPGTYLTEHEVPIEDLLPDTTYYFAPIAEDRSGQVFTGSTYEFTTLAGTAVDLMTNVALSSNGAGVSSVSSNWSNGANDSGYGADRAIDGQMTTEWSSDGDGDDAFLEVDLGIAREVSVIGVRSRKMADGTSIVKSFDLVVGEQVLGPFATPDPDVRYLIPLQPAVSMQVVRLRAVETTGGNTGLKEFQLFAH